MSTEAAYTLLATSSYFSAPVHPSCFCPLCSAPHPRSCPAVTDVALVTSLRDGMNLVSYEYVACQSDNAGVLVLSEFAGMPLVAHRCKVALTRNSV